MTTGTPSPYSDNLGGISNANSSTTRPTYPSAARQPFTPNSLYSQHSRWISGTARPWQDSRLPMEEQRGSSSLLDSSESEACLPGFAGQVADPTRRTNTARGIRMDTRSSLSSEPQRDRHVNRDPGPNAYAGRAMVDGWNMYSAEPQSTIPLSAHNVIPSDSGPPHLGRYTGNNEATMSDGSRMPLYSKYPASDEDVALRRSNESLASLSMSSSGRETAPVFPNSSQTLEHSRFNQWQAQAGAQSRGRSIDEREGSLGSRRSDMGAESLKQHMSTELDRALQMMQLTNSRKPQDISRRASDDQDSPGNPHMPRSFLHSSGANSRRSDPRSRTSSHWAEENYASSLMPLNRGMCTDYGSGNGHAASGTRFDLDAPRFHREPSRTSLHPQLSPDSAPDMSRQFGVSSTSRSPYLNGDLTTLEPSLARRKEDRYRQLYQYQTGQRSTAPSPSILPPDLVFGLPPGASYMVPYQHVHHDFAMPASSARPLPEIGSGHGYRSALLEEFKTHANSKSIHHYDLKDIYNHIVEFSTDQQGSRFIQNKLDHAGPDDRERVFREIQPEAILLMKDVFGNYVVQKFFEFGNQGHKAFFLSRMKGNMVELSRHVYACRVVQKALEHNILLEQQISIVHELNGSVQACLEDGNGNHVIQQIIKCVPMEHLGRMMDFFIGQVEYLSSHKFGCRIVQRLLDHCLPQDKALILERLHRRAPTLIMDQFGNYVPQHVIANGDRADRDRIIEVVKTHLIGFSRQKFASNVVEKCLEHGTEHQRRDIMRQLTARNEKGRTLLSELLRDPFGNYVIQKLLEVLRGTDFDYFIQILHPEVEECRLHMPQKQADNVVKKMHRCSNYSDLPTPGLTTSGSGSPDSSTDMTQKDLRYEAFRGDPTSTLQESVANLVECRAQPRRN